MCSTAVPQVTAQSNLSGKLPLIQRIASITTLDERGVVVEMRGRDGQFHEFVLAGPNVAVHSLPGEVFHVDDLNSHSVGGVLGQDEVTFIGDFMLTAAEVDAPTPIAGSMRIHVNNGQVEIHTQRLEDPADELRH